MCPVIYWIYQATRLLAGDLFCPVAQPVAWWHLVELISRGMRTHAAQSVLTRYRWLCRTDSRLTPGKQFQLVPTGWFQSLYCFCIYPSVIGSYSTECSSCLWAIVTEMKVCEFTKIVCEAECIFTSSSKQSRIFTSLTLLCATMKRRPWRDTETFNYSMPSSIKHKYNVHVVLIHILLREKPSFFLFFLQTTVKLIRYQDCVIEM